MNKYTLLFLFGDVHGVTLAPLRMGESEADPEGRVASDAVVGGAALSPVFVSLGSPSRRNQWSAASATSSADQASVFRRADAADDADAVKRPLFLLALDS